MPNIIIPKINTVSLNENNCSGPDAPNNRQ